MPTLSYLLSYALSKASRTRSSITRLGGSIREAIFILRERVPECVVGHASTWLFNVLVIIFLERTYSIQVGTLRVCECYMLSSLTWELSSTITTHHLVTGTRQHASAVAIREAINSIIFERDSACFLAEKSVYRARITQHVHILFRSPHAESMMSTLYYLVSDAL